MVRVRTFKKRNRIAGARRPKKKPTKGWKQGTGECKRAGEGNRGWERAKWLDRWMIASKRAEARDRRVQEGQGMGECKRAKGWESARGREQGMGDCKMAGEGANGWESAKGQERGMVASKRE
jgi:hypothetical protein